MYYKAIMIDFILYFAFQEFEVKSPATKITVNNNVDDYYDLEP